MQTALAALISAALASTHSTALTPADADGTWLQLTPSGTFSGRNGQGPWVTGDKASMEQIVANTRQYAGSTDLAIDYDHQTVFGAIPGVGGTAKAAGWVKELQARDDGIWGRVEWTAAAAIAIKRKEYRYLSPVFFHEKTTGRVLALRMAGLTNTPNLDLVAVAASALFPLNNPTGDSMEKILAALGLAKGTTEDSVVAAINTMQTSSKAIAKAAGLAESANQGEILTAVNSIVADRTKLATAAGLAADAKGDDIVTAVQSAIAGKVDPTKFVPIAMVTELQGDLKKLREDLTSDKATEAVNSAIEAGKIAPAQKEWALGYAKADLKAFDTFVGNAPVLTASQVREAKRPASENAGLSDADIAVCNAMGLDPKKFAETLKLNKETV
ncbi:MAG: hypothetical protein EOS18_03610 [Mesorhizobium sp.]|nr:MAG: hypothetical protein EOS18_03610 [Mesorhizobium sp.]